MDLRMLKNYEEWLKRSPAQVIDAVKNIKGGWAAVFPDRLPVWAHRVRNFFNREPRFLMRLSDSWSQSWLVLVYKKPRDRSNESTVQKFKRIMALTDYVYRDEVSTNWFQMSPGGAIYHFKEIGNETKEGIYQELLGQSLTPIFKLVSPDDTGGSMETIIINRGGGIEYASFGILPAIPVGIKDGEVIGDVNVPMPVVKSILEEERYQGSYNYAETVDLGNADHDRLDVTPHKDTGRYKTYVNPTDRFAPLKSRQFPKDVKGETRPLAEQI
jgi:hypothetical protein